MKLDIQLNKPIHDIHPSGWKETMGGKNIDYAMFRNVIHFKNYVSKLTQRNDMHCGVSYNEAVKDLIKDRSQLEEGEYETIRNLVRSNLLKRGLITEEIYESYKYDIDGVAVDVQKVIDGNPECFLKPSVSYINYFYELYINISYPGHISDKHVREQMCKILATIEELERNHIYIKVTLVDCSGNVALGNRNLITVVPLFNHKDIKDIKTMSAVLNERLLRKFMFAMSEDVYGEDLNFDTYGRAIELPGTIRPVNLNEIELYQSIYEKVVIEGKR